MAKRKRRRHHKNPPTARRARRRYRRNPPGRVARARGISGAIRELPAFAIQSLVGAGVFTGGIVVARKVRAGVFKQQPGTIISSVIEAVVGIAGGLVLCMLGHEGLGSDFAKGGVAAPLQTTVQQLGIPHVSDALGDDGYLIGPGTGVSLVSAYPADYAPLVAGVSPDSGMGSYVTGARPSPAQLGAYMAAGGM